MAKGGEILAQQARMRRRIQILAFERTRVIERRPVINCPICFSSEGLMTLTEASALLQAGEPSIRRWLAQGKAHGFKTPGGQYRICRKSLFQGEPPHVRQS